MKISTFFNTCAYCIGTLGIITGMKDGFSNHIVLTTLLLTLILFLESDISEIKERLMI